MQLTFVMMGGLGLAVSVLTLRGSEVEPSLLAVNPDTDNSYCVAGSEVENIVRWEIRRSKRHKNSGSSGLLLSDYYFSNLLKYPILAEVVPGSDIVFRSTQEDSRTLILSSAS